MKCLLKYQWVKLPRNQLPPGKGIMGAWARLASRAAFRNGHAKYCGYINKISVGGWAGGIVGLKSILGINRRQKALNLMGELADRGYITYSLDSKTKKMTYQVTDWVIRCSGEPCAGREAVYTTEGYDILCLPRNVTQRLVERHYQFAEADAWLDLWCRTVWHEPSNAFSHLTPAVQFGQYSNMVFTSNRDPAQWKENFCENDALLCALDRIFDDAVVFTIKGESFRGRKLETVALRTSTGSPADPQQAG